MFGIRSSISFCDRARGYPDKNGYEEEGNGRARLLSAEDEAKIDIRTLDVIEGRLPRRALALVLEWAQEHRAELIEDWELCSKNQYTRFPPALTSRIPWRVVQVEPLEGFRLSIRFVDGTTGTVDMSRLIQSPRAGVFAPLRDPSLFAEAFVEHGAVTWPGELDLAPDAMYAEIRKRGEWMLP